MNATPEHAVFVEVGEANFAPSVLRAEDPVIAFFWAPWSRPCQVIDTALKEAMRTLTGKVTVAKINADDNPTLSLWYDIQHIPTLVYFYHGAVRDKIVGTTSDKVILARSQSAFQDLGGPIPRVS